MTKELALSQMKGHRQVQVCLSVSDVLVVSIFIAASRVTRVRTSRRRRRASMLFPFNGRPATSGNGSMIAFLAPTEEPVSAAHAAGLAAGGTDEGEPGPRPPRSDGCLRDLDGSKVHIVYPGDIVAGSQGSAQARKVRP